ncbi:zinc finger protein interacting with ribonucleoprotein K-like isoform X2 [Hyperolius riggenbachi]|uniref:zinc finger protein interacting with ribonucleoprotein K-like isoform X2 n=1 Tax=Hyperolius riggenbachi TaxID=752182 RepID=UPI0035A2BFD3
MERGTEKRTVMSAMVTITFQDVAACFQESDWDIMEDWQQDLYRRAMKEIHSALQDLGYRILNPDLLVKIEKASRHQYLTEGSAVLVPDILLKIDQRNTSHAPQETSFRRCVPAECTRGSRSRKAGHPMKVKQEDEETHCSDAVDIASLYAPHELTVVVKPENMEEEQRDASLKADDRKSSQTTPLSDETEEVRDHTSDLENERCPEVPHGRDVGKLSVPLIGPDGDTMFLFSDAGVTLNSKLSQDSVLENALELEKYLKSLSHSGLLMDCPTLTRSEFDRGFYDNYSVRSKQRLKLMGEKRHRCAECGKGFTRNSHLKAHRRTHTGERPYKCLECHKTFSENSHLTVHGRVHSGEKHYKCNMCGKSFSENSNLIVHQRIHTGEKPYRCPECDLCFSQHSSLVRHRRKHTGARPYQCAQCEKTFSQKGHLSNHIRTHTGERPYKCAECGKSFSEHSHLTGHQKIHSGEKPYVCDFCQKAFSKISNLKAHRQIHTGYRPYACAQCGKCFTQHSTLVRHQKVHAGKMDLFWRKLCQDSEEANADPSWINDLVLRRVGSPSDQGVKGEAVRPLLDPS